MLINTATNFGRSNDASSFLLSDREMQIIKGLSDDLSVKMIACHIGISQFTVQDYIKHLKHKLKLHTAAGIVAKCLRDGVIQ